VAVNKEPYILLSLYSNLYEGMYSAKPTINRYKEKWAMQDVIDSIGFERSKNVLYYYFETGKNRHPLNFFYNNFERIEDMMMQIKEDKANRSRLLQETKKMIEDNE
jgi:hypothetical protein